MRTKKNKHGGKRTGSGRPRGETTKQVRIPISKINEVLKIINRDRDDKRDLNEICRHCGNPYYKHSMKGLLR